MLIIPHIRSIVLLVIATNTLCLLNLVESRNSSADNITLNFVSQPEWNHPLLGLFFITLSLITVFGNCLVICAVYKETCLQNATNFYIISLAVADLLVGFIVMPFNSLYEMTYGFWFFGDLWCDIWHSLDVFASTASILSLLTIALDRYTAISDPINYRNSWTNCYWPLLITTIWICSACISFPAIAYWRQTATYKPNKCLFTDDIYYLIFSSLVSFYIPLSVMIFIYIRIYQTALCQANALRCGHKQNVASSDGTQVTLRMHRGGYRGLNETTTDNNVRPSNKTQQLDTQTSLLDAKAKNLNSISNKKNSITITDNNSLRNYRSYKNVSKINKSLTSSTINQISKNRYLIAMALSYSELTKAIGPETSKKNQLSQFNFMNRMQQISELKKSAQKLQPKRTATVKLLTMLYYPPISREYNTKRMSTCKYNLIREQYRRGIRLNNLIEDQLLHLSISCNNMQNDLENLKKNTHNQTNLNENEQAKKNIFLELSPGKSSSQPLITITASRPVTRSPSFYKQHYEQHKLNNKHLILRSIFQLFACAYCRPQSTTDIYETSAQSINESSVANIDSEKRVFGNARVKLRRFAHEQRAARTLGIVMGVFICCWLPFFMLNVLTSVFQAQLPEKLHSIVFTVFTWLGYINSGCNPIIYAFSSRDFKRAFQKILCPKRNKYTTGRLKLIGEPKNCQFCWYYKNNYLNYQLSEHKHLRPGLNGKVKNYWNQSDSVSAQNLNSNSSSLHIHMLHKKNIRKSHDSLTELNLKQKHKSSINSSFLRRLRRRFIIVLGRRHTPPTRNKQFPVTVGDKFTFRKTDL